MINIYHCCGKTVKPVVKVIAFIDLLTAIAIALFGLITATYYPDILLSLQHKKLDDSNLRSTTTIVSIILIAVYFFLEACLFVLLQSAIRERDPGQCDNWFKIRLILLCIIIFGIIYYLASSVSINQIYIIGGICLILILYRIYTLVSVKAFHLEIIASKKLKDDPNYNILQRL